MVEIAGKRCKAVCFHRGNHMKLAGLIVVAVALCAGCATTEGVQYRSLGVPKGKPITQEDRARLLDEATADVLKHCKAQLETMEARAVRQRRTSFWVYGAGLIAGSVIAPALTAANAAKHAGAIAGLSGMAGAAGLAGKALEDTGFSGSSTVSERAKIAETIRIQLPTASNITEPDEKRYAALGIMQAACIAYDLTVPKGPGTKTE